LTSCVAITFARRTLLHGVITNRHTDSVTCYVDHLFTSFYQDLRFVAENLIVARLVHEQQTGLPKIITFCSRCVTTSLGLRNMIHGRIFFSLCAHSTEQHGVTGRIKTP
jgi:hypothetical protein